MKTILCVTLYCLIATTAFAADDPVLAHGKDLYGGASRILLRAAETMPEESYGFRPVDSVRTFGQIVGHVADAQYLFCSAAIGEVNPAPKIEKTKTSKADLVAALKDALAYCDRAHGSMTEASSKEMIKLMGSEAPRFGALSVNTVHSIEHYGNMVTYLRMKGLVPPTSDPEFMKQLMK